MLEVMAVISLIKTANDAFATVKQAKDNASTAWAGASKFLEAKAKIEVQATEDKAAGKTSTEAFVALIDLRRKEKELDEFITYQCEGWVVAEWQKHKKSVRDQVASETVTARNKIVKKYQRDDDISALFKALGIVAIIMGAVISLFKGDS